MPDNKTVFISYRREKGFYEARAIFQDLRAHGYDVFWDIESIDSGTFDTVILNQIAARAHFLLVLTPGTLDRTSQEGDWLRREIEHAVDLKRNIVPVTMKGFKIEDGKPYYTGKLAKLSRFNALDIPPGYFDAAMGKLRKRFLKQPVQGTIIPTPAADQAVVKEKIKKASATGRLPQIRQAIAGWKQSVSGRLRSLPQSLQYLISGVGMVLLLVLIFLGGKSLFSNGINFQVTPTRTLRVAVAGAGTKTPSPSPEPVPVSTATLTSEPNITPTPTPTPQVISDDYGVPMVLVQAGTFQMGSENGDEDEKPTHIISLDAYYIDQYEVTNARYAECVNDGECGRPKLNSSDTRNKYYGNVAYQDYPVVNVDWNDAKTYCAWRGASLPTEAQWEKAARGGLEGVSYPWGDEPPDCSLANFKNTVSCVGDTSQVGLHAPNGYGLYDMVGNVWEWTQSLYLEYPYNSTDGRENLNEAGMRAVRGGSWVNDRDFLKVFFRYYLAPSDTHGTLGFRCTRSP